MSSIISHIIYYIFTIF